MELINRYLHAVRFWLPRAQKDDIIAELAEDLRSQVEEREAGLGRKLDESAVIAMLRERGSPVLMASRYLNHQPLIGTPMLPIYWFGIPRPAT